MRLQRLEEEGGGEARGEDGAGDDDALGGARQRDLLEWYFKYLVERGAVKEKEAGVEELVLAEKIIAHLIKRERVLLVTQQPERQADEPAADYAKRLQNDRVLALNPNYSAE